MQTHNDQTRSILEASQLRHSHQNLQSRSSTQIKTTWWITSSTVDTISIKKIGNIRAQSAKRVGRLGTTYTNTRNTKQVSFKQQQIKRKKPENPKQQLTFNKNTNNSQCQQPGKPKQMNTPTNMQIAFQRNTTDKWVHANRRVGTPRLNWAETLWQKYWKNSNNTTQDTDSEHSTTTTHTRWGQENNMQKNAHFKTQHNTPQTHNTFLPPLPYVAAQQRLMDISNR